jgi:hypothetical protein
LLSDDSVDIAVPRDARGGIFRQAWAYDWSDCVGDDEYRTRTILARMASRSIDDIVWIKQLFAERVREAARWC